MIDTNKVFILLISVTLLFSISSCNADLNVINIFITDDDDNLLERDTGIYDFGMVFVSKSSFKTFFITQDSKVDKKLIGDPLIEISGDGASAFNVVSEPSTLIEPNESVFFDIQFKPPAQGIFNASITIESNDDTESPYIFNVTGKGYVTHFDFNGDNIDDWLVGSYADDDNGTSSGSAFIYFGAMNPSPTRNAQDADVKIVGNDEIDLFGFSLSAAGDFNNDGIDDLIVSAFYDDEGGPFSGTVYIFFGNLNPPSNMSASDADIKIIGANRNDRFGISVSTAGDYNNDGIGDVIIGSWLDDTGAVDGGAAYIFYGSDSSNPVMNATDADVILLGGNIDDRFGQSVANAGDFNNDGIDDVIVGVRHDDDGGENSGGAFLYFGSENPPAVINEVDADIKFIGGDSEDFFGFSVSGAGDFNSDGINDVVIGGYLDDEGGSDFGSAYIFYGRDNPNSEYDATEADITFTGEYFEGNFGFSVSKAGDYNNDGFDDVIVGSFYEDDGIVEVEHSYIFFGSANPPAVVNASVADIILIGEDELDNFGFSVSTAGDINRDGFDDVVVGARNDDDGGDKSGCVFLFFGDSELAHLIDASDADIKIQGDDEGDSFGYAVSGGN